MSRTDASARSAHAGRSWAGWLRSTLMAVALAAGALVGVQAPAGANELLELPAPATSADPGTHEGSTVDAGQHQVGHPNLARHKANANDLSLEGTYGYTISNGTVRIEADRVVNRRSGGVSGTIRLELWALSSPYGGGNWSGYKIGQTTLGTLNAGFQYANIDRTVTQLSTPPQGTWYLTLMVTEFTGNALNDGFVSRDWGNFSTPWIIGDLALEGTVAYTIAGGSVRLQVDRIANRRSGGTSGSLRVELWATSTPYGGGGLSGYKIGQTSFNPLSAGFSYVDIDRTVTQLVTPPNGTWYLVMTLTEFTGSASNDGYTIANYRNFSSPWVIGAPPATTVTVYEFYNTIINHYFRTSSLAEVNAIAGGSAGPGWVRTQDDFTAYAPQTAAPGNDVCRFYTFGANSHFYTAFADECLGLRSPTSGWVYEGLSFRIQLPGVGGCAAGLRPVYRMYNNRFAFNDSNHRFTTSFSEVQRLTSAPHFWLYEGIAFCALN